MGTCFSRIERNKIIQKPIVCQFVVSLCYQFYLCIKPCYKPITNTINIGRSTKLQCWCRTDLKRSNYSSPKITKNAQNFRIMNIMRDTYKLVGNMHSMCNIMPRNSKQNKNTNKLIKSCRFKKWISHLDEASNKALRCISETIVRCSLHWLNHRCTAERLSILISYWCWRWCFRKSIIEVTFLVNSLHIKKFNSGIRRMPHEKSIFMTF